MFKFYKNYWKQYFDFKGESSLAEFWSVFLFNFIIWVILLVPGYFVNVIGILDCIISVAFIIPSISITVRRLHNTGRSGFQIFWGLLPVFGWIFLIIFLVDRSANNNYIKKDEDSTSQIEKDDKTNN